jgi:type I restriction enzyme S subunit
VSDWTQWTASLSPSWTATPLKAIAAYSVSSVDKIPVDGELPIRLCNYTDVYYHEYIHAGLDFTTSTATNDEAKKFHLRVDDVIITKDSESWDDIAVPALVTETAEDLVCGYHLAILRPSGGRLLGRFLFRCLQARPIRIQLELAASTGVTRFGLPISQIGRLLLPVPPIEQQGAIADFLDRETAKVDDLIARKVLLIERLKEIRRSTISRLATMGTCDAVATKDSGVPCIGQIPNHWQLLRNKNILREIDDRSSDGTEELLTVSHITGVSPRRENQQVTMFMAESNEGYKRCLPDDIVINTMWAWMGALGVSIYAGLVSPAYNVYRFKQKAVPWYFHHLFRSPQYVAEIGRYSRGVWTSRLRLYPEEFLNMTSPVPPLDEQSKIASLIDDQNKAASKESEIITAAISLLREYRSALISAAVTGQLDLRQHETQLEALA